MLNLFAIGRGILRESAAREARRRRTTRRKFQPAGPPEIRLENREMQSLAFYFTGGTSQRAYANSWAGIQRKMSDGLTGAAMSVIAHEFDDPNTSTNPPAFLYEETSQTSSTIANSQTIGGATNKLGTYASIINTDDITNVTGQNLGAGPPIMAFGNNRSAGTFFGEMPPSPTDYTWQIAKAPDDPGYNSIDLHFHFSASLSTSGIEGFGRTPNAFQTAAGLNYTSTFFNVTGPIQLASGAAGFRVIPTAVANSTSSIMPVVDVPWGGGYDMDFTVTTPNSAPLTVGTGFNITLQTNPSGTSAFSPGRHLHSATLSMAAEYSLKTA